MPTARKSRDGWLRRFRERLRNHRPLDLTWRAGVLTVGFAVVVAGVAMLALPGPGWASIFLGLAILATEFAWAHRLLGWSKRQALLAAERALDPRARRRNIMLATAGLITVVVVVTVLIVRYGLLDMLTALFNR